MIIYYILYIIYIYIYIYIYMDVWTIGRCVCELDVKTPLPAFCEHYIRKGPTRFVT